VDELVNQYDPIIDGVQKEMTALITKQSKGIG
jgi:hypothetical protein